MDDLAWGFSHVREIIAATAPPGERLQGFDDRMLFVHALTLSLQLGDDGKLLLSELRKKWPEGVENYWHEAERLIKQPHPKDE